MRLLADTSALLALFLSDEKNHRAAARFLHENPRARFVLTELVFSELVTHLRSRVGAPKAVATANKLLESQRFELLFVDIVLLGEALKRLERYRDKRLSLTDCASFATIERLKLDAAFAFDADFRDCGFPMVP